MLVSLYIIGFIHYITKLLGDFLILLFLWLLLIMPKVKQLNLKKIYLLLAFLYSPYQQLNLPIFLGNLGHLLIVDPP